MNAVFEFIVENRDALLAGAAAVLLGGIWLARKIVAKTKSQRDDEAVERVAAKLALLAEVLTRLSEESKSANKQKTGESGANTR